MKTLDEVINTMVFESQNNTGEWTELDTDALRYLKEYQQYQNTPSRNGHMALVDYFEESQKNKLLTWDELSQMAGKPVWIEELSYGKRWYGFWDIISYVKDYDDEKTVYTKSEMGYKMDEYGETWQAYRKERDDDN